MRQRRLTINHSMIEVLESDGQGPPIFLCHGNSGSASSWERLLKGPLGRKRRMVAISFPGHGNSDCAEDPGASYSIEALGRLAAAVVHSYGSPRCWLVGHSLGGHAILEALDDFPGALGVLLISSPPLSLSTLGLAFKKPDPSDGCLFKGELTKEETDHLASCFAGTGNGEMFDTIRANILRTDPRFRVNLGISLSEGRMRDERRIFETTRLPIALLAGTEDRFLNADYYASLPAQQMWGGRPVMFEGRGHALHLETPEQFEQVLSQFLDATAKFALHNPGKEQNEDKFNSVALRI